MYETERMKEVEKVKAAMVKEKTFSMFIFLRVSMYSMLELAMEWVRYGKFMENFWPFRCRSRVKRACERKAARIKGRNESLKAVFVKKKYIKDLYPFLFALLSSYSIVILACYILKKKTTFCAVAVIRSFRKSTISW